MDYKYQQFVFDQMIRAAEEAGCSISLYSTFEFSRDNMEDELGRYLNDEEYEKLSLDVLQMYDLI